MTSPVPPGQGYGCILAGRGPDDPGCCVAVLFCGCSFCGCFLLCGCCSLQCNGFCFSIFVFSFIFIYSIFIFICILIFIYCTACRYYTAYHYYTSCSFDNTYQKVQYIMP